MNYFLEYRDRDSKLPVVREQMVNKINEILKDKQGIEGIFLGGSLANNTSDSFSDIDLRIVVSEDDFEKFFTKKREIAVEFGEVLFFEDQYTNAPYTIAHYNNFIKVDFFIYTFSQLTLSIWLQGIKILFDPTDQLQSILNQSNEIVYEVTKEEVERWRNKIFAHIHEVYRRVMREEYYYALNMINNLRAYMVAGWNMEANRHSNEPWDWSKIEGKRSILKQWQLTMLESWFCGRNQKEIMETLSNIIIEFRRLHTALCEKTGLEKEEGKFNQIINQVMK